MSRPLGEASDRRNRQKMKFDSASLRLRHIGNILPVTFVAVIITRVTISLAVISDTIWRDQFDRFAPAVEKIRKRDTLHGGIDTQKEFEATRGVFEQHPQSLRYLFLSVTPLDRWRRRP